MPIDFGSHGLEYTHDLCTAIEQYTASEVYDTPRAFEYRGMQLRYAVERWLYIQCINSEPLFRHYLDQRSGGSGHSALPALNPLESDIAYFMAKQRLPGERPPKRRGRWFLGIARRVYGWWLRRRRPQVREVGGAQRCDILIHVINAKFAKYMEPVTTKLIPGSFSYLQTSDPELGVQLTEGGYPVISFPTEGSALRHIFCSYALSEFTQLLHDADALLAALRGLQPACVVVVEGNAPSDVISAEACHLLGIPCYCVQQGWSPYVHSGFRNMNFSEVFVWGERFAELLRPHNPGQVFRVTGSHAVQGNLARPARDRVETLSFFLQAPCALLGVKGYGAFVDMIVEVSEAHPEVSVIVRNHPGYPLPNGLKEKLATCPNVHFSDPTYNPVAEVIAVADLVVSVFSTVLLEAMSIGVVPLICSIGAIKRYDPDIASVGAAIEVCSIAEARRAIDYVIAEPARLEEIRDCMRTITDAFFSKEDAAKTIAEHLLRERKLPGRRGQ